MVEVFPSEIHFAIESRNIISAKAISESEFRYLLRSQQLHRPFYEYTMRTDNLTDAQEKTLTEFWIAHQFDEGGEDSFYLDDPKDPDPTGENFGPGDGSTKTFQLKRNLSYGSRSKTLLQRHIIPGTETIYKNGSEVAATDYTLDDETGVVTFDTAPADGDVLKADFEFYRKVIFKSNLEYTDVNFVTASTQYDLLEIPR